MSKDKKTTILNLELAGMKRALLEVDQAIQQNKEYVHESKGSLIQFFSTSLKCRKSTLKGFKQILLIEVKWRDDELKHVDK
ncbi:hypothetical protein [Photobacterium indicum]|uniref:Uncharacterized protein n=1 Tax=Photobacterium indicum TaxID=81447 RepID=A0A2T3LF53_9GAMM|nr:hypothetical protein [Photobacterium indicum]PSV50023.1 hypothetical protein C9J47_05595 [Photobacterium indicum]